VIRTIDTNADCLLTREQVAAMLGLDPHTLACWRSEGRGPAFIKFGSNRSAAVRYRRSAVEAWLANPPKVEASSKEEWREERRRAAAAKAEGSCGKNASPKSRHRVSAKPASSASAKRAKRRPAVPAKP
jgi:hypothetical protein